MSKLFQQHLQWFIFAFRFSVRTAKIRVCRLWLPSRRWTHRSREGACMHDYMHNSTSTLYGSRASKRESMVLYSKLNPKFNFKYQTCSKIRIIYTPKYKTPEITIKTPYSSHSDRWLDQSFSNSSQRSKPESCPWKYNPKPQDKISHMLA